MTLAEHLQAARQRLSLVTDSARLDAELILAHVMNCSRAALYARDDDEVGADHALAVDGLISRRAQGEPVSYLIGSQGFWNLELAVSPDVLIPRPETETLIEWLVELQREQTTQSIRVVDMGTGSGCIALSIAKNLSKASVIATDLSQAALDCARQNALRLQVRQIEFAQGSWFEALSQYEGQKFNYIVSNPPYIADGDVHLAQLKFEPRQALVSGKDGLDDLRTIIAGAPPWLESGGTLMVEHGFEQGEAVRELFAQSKYAAIQTRRDLGGRDRVTAGRLA